ncbi:hypothetical protein DL765_008603 [Monosporascus sp. GIB2]|nr:hypothetical protein DL765_008603 [Monosporascus sp. GIB2]
MAPTGGGQDSSSGPKETSAWQVAASNSTLNTWFGGRRQPSWMANAKPVNPTPRLPQPKPQPQQHTETTAPLTIFTTTPPQQQQQHRQPNATITAHPPRLLHSQQQPQQSQPAQTSRVNLVQEAVLPSPAPSDEPSPSVSHPHESPNAANCDLPASPAEAAATDPRLFVLNGQPDNLHPPPPEQREVQDLTRATTAQPPLHQSNEPPVTSEVQTPAAMVLNTPPTQSASAFRGVVQQNDPQVQVAKRRRIENPSVELLQRLRASDILRKHVLTCKPEARPEWYIEQARYQLVQDACERGDLFFIAFHQLFCTWTAAAHEVRQLCEDTGHNVSLVEAAFGIMGTILKSNSSLRQMHVKWLSNFPAPLIELRNDTVYADSLRMVLDFLLRVAFEWMIVGQEHQASGYPLLMDELVNRFNVLSPVLQETMFRASWRNLGIRDDQIGFQMEALFREDQRLYGNGSNAISNPVYRNTIVRRYRALVLEAKVRGAQGQQQAAPPHPAGAHQRAGPLQAPRVQSNPQQGVHQRAGPLQAPRIQTNPQQDVGVRPVPAPIVTSNASSFTRSPITSPMPLNSSIGNYSTTVSGPSNLRRASNHSLLHQTRTTTPLSYSSPYSPPNHAQQTQFGFTGVNTYPAFQQGQQQQDQYYQTATAPSPRLQQGQQTYQPFSEQQPQRQYSAQQPWQPQSAGRPSCQPLNASDHHSSSVLPRSVSSVSAINQHITANTSRLGLSEMNVHQTQRASPMTHIRPSSVRPQSSAPRSHQQHGIASSERLIPPPQMRISMQDYPHDPYQRSCLINSLHQAHLRSPKRIRKDDHGAPAERYYQAVKSFLLEPVPTPPHRHLHKFTFRIPDIIHARIARDEILPGQSLPVIRFSSGSLLVRVRCCYMKKSTTTIPDRDWVTTDTTWPEHIFMEVNGNPLGIRRKAHHSRDLPVEISALLVPGDNSLNVFIPLDNRISRNHHPVVAVEVIEILSHSAILNIVKATGTMSADETRGIIKGRLTGSSGSGDDDELAMVDSELSIDLADPFTFSIFTIPVRGKSCTHLECFDLETWLNTRLGKKSICACGTGPDCQKCKEPSFVDKWKCPLCDGDARPYSLRIDGFLSEVRAQLEQENKLRTKSILVSADGSWRPKEQPGEDDSDVDSDGDGAAPVASARSSARPTQPASARSSARPTQPPHEVIELDDD